MIKKSHVDPKRTMNDLKKEFLPVVNKVFDGSDVFVTVDPESMTVEAGFYITEQIQIHLAMFKRLNEIWEPKLEKKKVPQPSQEIKNSKLKKLRLK